MSAFAGIDYDTKGVYIVLVDEDIGQPRTRIVELEGRDAFERTRSVRDKMPGRSWWEDEGVTALCIEEPFARGKLMIQNQPKLKAVQGAILACLPRDLLVNPMGAPTWRNAVGLKGNCTKDEVREWARTHGMPTLASYAIPQDLADAYCLAKAAEKLTVPA